MTFTDVESLPQNIDEICEVVAEILESEPAFEEAGFVILGVECLQCELVSGAQQEECVFGSAQQLFSRNRGLRRQLQSDVLTLGDLNIEYRVTGEYRDANRANEEVKDVEFDTLLEVGALEVFVRPAIRTVTET